MQGTCRPTGERRGSSPAIIFWVEADPDGLVRLTIPRQELKLWSVGSSQEAAVATADEACVPATAPYPEDHIAAASAMVAIRSQPPAAQLPPATRSTWVHPTESIRELLNPKEDAIYTKFSETDRAFNDWLVLEGRKPLTAKIIEEATKKDLNSWKQKLKMRMHKARKGTKYDWTGLVKAYFERQELGEPLVADGPEPVAAITSIEDHASGCLGDGADDQGPSSTTQASSPRHSEGDTVEMPLRSRQKPVDHLQERHPLNLKATVGQREGTTIQLPPLKRGRKGARSTPADDWACTAKAIESTAWQDHKNEQDETLLHSLPRQESADDGSGSGESADDRDSEHDEVFDADKESSSTATEQAEVGIPIRVPGTPVFVYGGGAYAWWFIPPLDWGRWLGHTCSNAIGGVCQCVI